MRCVAWVALALATGIGCNDSELTRTGRDAPNGGSDIDIPRPPRFADRDTDNRHPGKDSGTTPDILPTPTDTPFATPTPAHSPTPTPPPTPPPPAPCHEKTLLDGCGTAARAVLGPVEVAPRKKGKPFTQWFDFDGEPGATYELCAVNGSERGTDRVSSAVLRINGEVVLGPREFSQKVRVASDSFVAESFNQLDIELRAKPGGYLTIVVQEHCPPEPALP